MRKKAEKILDRLDIRGMFQSYSVKLGQTVEVWEMDTHSTL